MTFAFAHAQDVRKDIRQQMDNVRNKKPVQFDYARLADAGEAKKALKELPVYLSDENAEVRETAAFFIQKCGQYSADKKTRQAVVAMLVDINKDTDAGIAGYAARSLTAFSAKDFSNTAKSKIKDRIQEHGHAYDQIILVSGLAQMNEMIPLYKAKLVHDTLLTKKDRWALHLAMARLGEPTEVKYIVNQFKKFQVNDDVIYTIVPDMIYTRQKPVFDELIEVLHSNYKDCHSSNPDNPASMVCGYRIMEYLAPVVEDFPYETYASGDIKTDDYEKALADVRQWFKDNPEFNIIKDRY